MVQIAKITKIQIENIHLYYVIELNSVRNN